MSKDKYPTILSKTNECYCGYHSNIFLNLYSFENWGIINNYSPRCWWLAVDIYQAAKQRGKYLTLATNTEVHRCFSTY